MTTEQRVHSRVPGGFYGNWRRAMPGASVAGDGIVANLSVGGCSLEARESLPPAGARVRLQLDLPLAGWTWLSSQVVHMHPNRGFGVRFVDLTPRDQEALARTVEHLS